MAAVSADLALRARPTPPSSYLAQRMGGREGGREGLTVVLALPSLIHPSSLIYPLFTPLCRLRPPASPLSHVIKR